MKVFLDDYREPIHCSQYMYRRIGPLNPIYLETDWVIVKNYNEFVELVSKHVSEITHISFDHDLDDEHYHQSMYLGLEEYEKHIATCKEKTGYDCALYLKQLCLDSSIALPIIFVHSMNPAGTRRIMNVFNL